MASIISSLSISQTKITLSIPRPVIIWAGMEMLDWKNCFIQKKEETDILDEEYAYEACLKALMWAEFCNGSLVKVGSPSGVIELTFEFPTLRCKKLFELHLDEHLEVVTLV